MNRANRKLPLHLSSFPVPTRPPQDVTGEPIDPRTLRLSWNPPPLEHQNGDIREYKINITEVETETELQHLMSITTTLTVSNLHPSYHYQCSIAAVTIGTGPYSDIFTVQTREDGRLLLQSRDTVRICYETW